MNIKKIYSTSSLKDFIAICFTGMYGKFFKKNSYKNYYSYLLNLITIYSEKGYRVSTYKKQLLINGKNKFANFKFLIRPKTSDVHVFTQVIEQEEYRPLVDFISTKNLTNDIKTIIDAGANVGFTTIYLKNYFKNSKVICVEADGINSKQLKKNIQVNSLDGETIVLNNALWNIDNEILVIKNDFRDGESWSKSVGIKPGEGEYEKVHSITLNGIIEKYHLEYVDILKIDIEGAEKDLFEDVSFLSVLHNKVKVIAIEIHDELNIQAKIEMALLENDFEIFVSQETTFFYNKSLVN